MKRWVVGFAALCLVMQAVSISEAGCAPVYGHSHCGLGCGYDHCGVTYCTQYQTVTRQVCEYVPVTTMVDVTVMECVPVTKTENRTECYYEQVVKNVPVTRTVYKCEYVKQKQKVAVCRPVTKNVEETYTVCVPVTRTQKQTYQVCVPVTRTEKQTYQVCVPVTRTQKQTYQVCVPVTRTEKQTYQVCVPVTRTEKQQYTVCVPVNKVVEQDVCRTIYETVPVTRCCAYTCYAPVTVCTPVCDPCGGYGHGHSCGPISHCSTCYMPVQKQHCWTEYQCVAKQVVEKVRYNVCEYQHQVQTRDVQVCSFEYKTHTQDVQVCSYEMQTRTQDVQVCTHEMQTRTQDVQVCTHEWQTRTQDVQVCTYEHKTEKRTVPVCTYETVYEEQEYTVCVTKPHTETIQVQQCELVLKTRNVPCTYTVYQHVCKVVKQPCTTYQLVTKCVTECVPVTVAVPCCPAPSCGTPCGPVAVPGPCHY